MSLNTGEIEAPAFDLERLLREQKALLDSACVGIAFVKNRTIVRCNPHFAKIFGFTSHDEVVGVRSAQLHPSLDDFKALIRMSCVGMRQGKTFKTERRLRRRNGDLFWGSLSGHLINPSAPHEGAV